ncbi:MAG TPA: shikimate dehydrogenase, partial [Aestuariivirga sp.]|nr:shikimate dehydrogenase [Aestuariivirga sp.]
KTKVKAELAVWKGAYSIPAAADIVINATSIGLYPDVNARLDIALDSLRKGLVVADVIPNPPRTNLIKDAEARGCKTLDGLGMLVNQGVIGVKYWTGVDVDPAVMKRKLEEIFSA